MSDGDAPLTLGDLLATLEKSDRLRSLARECGMSPRDLQKRLRQWRRELADAEAGGAPTPPRRRRRDAGTDDLDALLMGLPAAADLAETPLPADAERLLAWTDGASRGNPGPAAVGVVFTLADGTPLAAQAAAIGRATNNVAEYRAALAALEHAVRWQVPDLELRLDSELVARQLTGQYRVKSQDLLPYYRQVVDRTRRLQRFRVRHVRREQNRLADRLANLALDGRWPLASRAEDTPDRG